MTAALTILLITGLLFGPGLLIALWIMADELVNGGDER